MHSNSDGALQTLPADFAGHPTELGQSSAGGAVTALRRFPTGAIRDTAADKLDFDGFLAPEVIERFAAYMHKNRKLPDGTLRDSDDWQRGIPPDVYRKSLWRHFFDCWKLGRHGVTGDVLEEALCAVIFNASGWLLELLKKR